jgi:hypothetical protein
VKVSLKKTLLVGGFSFIALLPVRTSMALPVVASILLITIFLNTSVTSRRKGPGFKLMIGVVGLSLLSLGYLLQSFAGGDAKEALNFAYIMQNVSSLESNVANTLEWSENSIGLLLAPHNEFQFFLFILPRTVLYLVAPLPNITFSLTDLLAGSWGSWHTLFTIPGSVLNILALPYALAGLIFAYHERKQNPAPLAIHISFWITLLAIAGGNIIIHERYRLMMTLLFFTSAWFGYTSCTRRQIRQCAVAWYGMLVCSTMFYILYKFI